MKSEDLPTLGRPTRATTGVKTGGGAAGGSAAVVGGPLPPRRPRRPPPATEPSRRARRLSRPGTRPQGGRPPPRAGGWRRWRQRQRRSACRGERNLSGRGREARTQTNLPRRRHVRLFTHRRPHPPQHAPPPPLHPPACGRIGTGARWQAPPPPRPRRRRRRHRHPRPPGRRATRHCRRSPAGVQRGHRRVQPRLVLAHRDGHPVPGRLEKHKSKAARPRKSRWLRPAWGRARQRWP